MQKLFKSRPTIISLFFVFFFLAFGLACKKYGKGAIEGSVLETNTHTPKAGIKVIISDCEKKLTYPCDPKPMDSVFTDSEGHYKIEFDKKRGHRYFINLSGPDLFYGAGSPNDNEVREKRVKMNYFIDPAGFVKIHVKKTTTSFAFFSGSVDGNPNFINCPRLDEPFDTLLTDVFKVRGNATAKIQWVIGSRQDGVPALFMPAAEKFVGVGDTVIFDFQIN